MKLFIYSALIELVAATLLLSTGSKQLLRLENLLAPEESDVDINLCIDPKLISCQNQFNTNLNITGNADWTSPDTLAFAIDSYLLAGVDGLLQLCRTRTQFFQCLGNTYPSCINRFYFLRKGYSMDASVEYVQLMKDLEFMCDGGLLQAIRSWPCILTVAYQSNATFYNCLNAFNQSITAHPETLCTAAQTLTACMSAPFIANCGQQVGWWECERLRVALEFFASCPDLVCSIGGSFADRTASNKCTSFDDSQKSCEPPESPALFRSFAKGSLLVHQKIAEAEDQMLREVHSLQ